MLDTERIYNYRHSHARRVVENAFGILSVRWRIFKKPMEMDRAQVCDTNKACIALHNFLLKRDEQEHSTTCVTPHFVDSERPDGTTTGGEWRLTTCRDNGMLRFGGNRSAVSTRCVRDKFRDYFTSQAGGVPWQNEKTFGVCTV